MWESDEVRVYRLRENPDVALWYTCCVISCSMIQCLYVFWACWSIFPSTLSSIQLLQEYCKNFLCCEPFLRYPEPVQWSSVLCEFSLNFRCCNNNDLYSVFSCSSINISSKAHIFVQLEQKQKYAAWKAADIRKALKEGRKPQAGPPGDDKDLSEPSNGEYVWYLYSEISLLDFHSMRSGSMFSIKLLIDLLGESLYKQYWNCFCKFCSALFFSASFEMKRQN